MRTAGSKVTRIASVCPSPSQTLSYVGAGVSPPVYPTRVATTPSSSLKMSSGFQNHPTPKYATLVVSGAADDGTHRAVTPTRCEDARRRRAGVTVGTDAASADAIISARAKVRITFGKPNAESHHSE